MSAEATGDCWRNSPLVGDQLLVHLAIADVVNDLHGNLFWMERQTLADKSRTSVSTVARAFTVLIREGWMTIVTRGGGRGHPTEYRYTLGGKPCQPDLLSGVTVSPDAQTVSSGSSHPLSIPRTQGAGKTGRRRVAHTPWPEDFSITDNLLAFAAREAPDVDVRQSMMVMKRWAKSGAVKQADWTARAEQWLIDDQRRLQPRPRAGAARTYLGNS